MVVAAAHSEHHAAGQLGSRREPRVENMLVHSRVLDRPARAGDLISFRPIDKCANDLLGVAEHGNVRVMRHHDNLAALLNRSDNRDQQEIDSLVVQVFFRLIDDDRAVALVHQKVEDQQQRAPLAR